MKLFITLLILSATASATTLGQYISTPDGTSVQVFQISSGKVSYEKKSNFFDKKIDLGLGKFSTNYKLSDKDQTKLSSTLSKIKTVDELMKKKNSSFNELSMKTPHESFLMLDEYRVSQQSDLYPELKSIYDNLLSQNWKQESGIKLTEDYKTVIHVKDGKETSREKFNFPFHCQQPEPPTQCMFKDYGILILTK